MKQTWDDLLRTGRCRLCRMQAQIDVNTMAEASGIHLPPTKPLRFAERLDVLIWPLRRADQDGARV